MAKRDVAEGAGTLSVDGSVEGETQVTGSLVHVASGAKFAMTTRPLLLPIIRQLQEEQLFLMKVELFRSQAVRSVTIILMVELSTVQV